MAVQHLVEYANALRDKYGSSPITSLDMENAFGSIYWDALSEILRDGMHYNNGIGGSRLVIWSSLLQGWSIGTPSCSSYNMKLISYAEVTAIMADIDPTFVPHLTRLNACLRHLEATIASHRTHCRK
ncbi:hypothetical protein RUM43_015050 [Polyplax serrata]|uniref:Reverse transcriptase domain-containing protein n=1 Tax=Polyplax serrata TaxID=468196 RepID=A0AAN8PHW7_POLSC